MSDERAEPLGKELNQTAWERGYIERGLAAPASGIETTYFHLLGRGLEAANLPARIDVFAAGAWKAVQEVRALRLHIEEYRPDLVVLLDGLDDLTVGTTSQALYVEVVETEEGSERPRHARDRPRRIADYLGQVREAAEIMRAHGSALLIVLQPSLMERRPPCRSRIHGSRVNAQLRL